MQALAHSAIGVQQRLREVIVVLRLAGQVGGGTSRRRNLGLKLLGC